MEVDFFFGSISFEHVSFNSFQNGPCYLLIVRKVPTFPKTTEKIQKKPRIFRDNIEKTF